MTRPPLLAIVDQLRAELAELDHEAMTWFVALFSAPDVSPRAVLARVSVACLEDHCHECIGVAESGRPCIDSCHDEPPARGGRTQQKEGVMPGTRIETGTDGRVHRLVEVGRDEWLPPWMNDREAAAVMEENSGPPEARAAAIAERAIAAGYPRVTPVDDDPRPVLTPPPDPKRPGR